jgi:ribosomal protein S18 acetylase RimI-like enzyme
VIIRRIRADEGLRYKALRLRALKSDPYAYLQTWEKASGRTDESWHEQAARNASGDECALFFAEHDGELVGLAGTMREPGDRELFGVYQTWVAPEARGAGVGAQLQALEAFARAAGATTMQLVVYDAAQDARRLYQRAGFVPDGERMIKRLTGG